MPTERKMKKRKLKYLVFVFVLMMISLLYVFGLKPIKSVFFDEYYLADEPVLAIFYKNGKVSAVENGNVLHYKAVLKNTGIWSKGSFEEAMKDHDLLITVETWLKGWSGNKNVLQEISGGHFDENIRKLGEKIAASKHKIYIRWAPDMEVPAMEYPWQFQSSAYYCSTFNYFARKIKQYAPKAFIVWGPSGYPGDTEYWPGNKEVDLASITLGSRSEYNLNVYPRDKTIPAMLKHKLHRLRFIDKPVLIIKGSELPAFNFQQQWLKDQKNYMETFKSTVYSIDNYTDTGETKPFRKHLKIGVFDPNRKLVAQNFIQVEHIFTDWGEIQRGDFEKKFLEVINRRHEPIVTMEPWREINGTEDRRVLTKILAGKYDAEIRKLFRIISIAKSTVYLRWMHEMEIPIYRYSWQSQDPVMYINTFRYFMQFEGGPGKNVRKIWGPAGDRGSIDFWPGDDVVDYISIAIYGLPDKNITDPAKQETFRAAFERKFRRMRFSDKPLFITEFGVKGPEEFQDKWLKGAAETIKHYPQVFGICYFNLQDNPKAWGSIKAPDWSITSNSMRRFADALKKEL